ncbi:coiled-coil domain-containing protein 175 [Gastrophryne carolinensis]
MASRAECGPVAQVLEHIVEVERQLKEKDSVFFEEAVQHLMVVADAVKELEDTRKTTRELLEEETIENSKLRYKITHLPAIIAKEIEDAVTSACESISLEILQLQNDLKNISLDQENTEKKQLMLEEQNLSLGDHGRTLWEEHQEAVEILNQHMADKAGQSILVNQTHNRRKKAEEDAIDYRHKTEDLTEDMDNERKRFHEEMENLAVEILETQRKTETQEAKNEEKKNDLEQRRSVLFDLEEKINKEKEVVSALKSSILLQQASHGRLTDKLDFQKKQSADLSNKIDILELRMVNQKEDFNQQSNSLNEQLLKLEEEMNTQKILQESLAEKHKALKQEYQAASEEEDRQHAFKKDLSLQLDKSTAVLNEKQELLGKIRKELKEMEQESEKLVESMRLTAQHLAFQVEESRQNLGTERQKRMIIQNNKNETTKEMELWKLSEEAIINGLKQRITTGQDRQKFYTKEGTRLQKEIKHLEKEIFSVTEELERNHRDYLQEEHILKEQIKTLEEKLEASNKHLQSEQERLTTNIPIKNEAEDSCIKENKNYEDLKKFAAELKSKQKTLEVSIAKMCKDTEAHSKIKEAKKISLKELRDSAFKKLQCDLQSIKQADINIYEINRKLELVNMENCRLKLQNAQYKDGIAAMKAESKKHTSASKQLEGDLNSLVEHLHKCWEEDHNVCNDFSERDQEILDSIVELLKKIHCREEKIGYLNGALQGKLAGISSILQIKTGMICNVRQHSVGSLMEIIRYEATLHHVLISWSCHRTVSLLAEEDGALRFLGKY